MGTLVVKLGPPTLKGVPRAQPHGPCSGRTLKMSPIGRAIENGYQFSGALAAGLTPTH